MGEQGSVWCLDIRKASRQETRSSLSLAMLVEKRSYIWLVHIALIMLSIRTAAVYSSKARVEFVLCSRLTKTWSDEAFIISCSETAYMGTTKQLSIQK
jgi:hypothetical protein